MKTILHKILLTSMLLLAGCQAQTANKTAPTPPPAARTVVPLPSEAAGATSFETTAPPVEAQSVQQTASVANDPAAAVAEKYQASLQSGEFKAAAEMLSSFSLTVFDMTHSEASDILQTHMAHEKWSDFQIKETRSFNDKTVLVHVVYKAETDDPKSDENTLSDVDALWPVRLENGEWRYNLGNLIDFHTLDVPTQTTAGLTVRPRMLIRYSDRIVLSMLVQNQTNEPIVLGQPNEIMATFLFREQQIEAEKNQLIFDRLRSYPDVKIEAKGKFDAYPDGVVIRQWKGLKVAPWFTFTFSQ
jgi:hypothetical protein